jgi:uncharacterized 2Fe-2S/4Fe-4S cluster protein (DUF4445 family)
VIDAKLKNVTSEISTVQMHKIIISTPSGDELISTVKGTFLRDILLEKGYKVYSPCGGNGTCGKCIVSVIGEGHVRSCRYIVDHDITIYLPDSSEMEILQSQHQFTIKTEVSLKQEYKCENKPVGIAIDLGTTTIVYYLVCLESGVVISTIADVNPQAIYGADVISRINFCITEKDGLVQINRLTVDEINMKINLLLSSNNIDISGLVRITFTGNTTMMHIIAGERPDGIALAPFRPLFVKHRLLSSECTGLVPEVNAEVHLLPSISAYVGSDVVAGLSSIKIEDLDTCLYIDIGTNGEMALVSGNKILCCATAAGPAFEGANIKCGMGAFAGAVNKYGKNGYSTIGNSEPTGICGSGLVDVVAYLLNEGILSDDGDMPEPFVLFKGNEADDKDSVIIDQADVREVQLAKGAIAAGMQILLKKAGLKWADVDKMIIAGGFGNYINIENAIRIGLLPAGMKGKIIQLGNTAGAGAVNALISDLSIDEMSKLAEQCEYIELSYEEEFTSEFVMNMPFRKTL